MRPYKGWSFYPLLLMWFYALLYVVLAVAHHIPGTDKEIEVQKRLQAAAYHCAPDIAQFTASRKRQFAQTVLSGQPKLPVYDDLFTPYEDEVQDHQTLMSCTPVERELLLQNNNSCVLTPVVTEGPLYHKEGHIIRQNIADHQDGLLLLLDIGVIDVNTCQPLPNVLVDLWQANATGYYSGQSAHGVRTNFVESFLRGAWPTDDRGVAKFVTIFPGYYPLRATHIHTKVFTQWEKLSNGTFRSDELIHVGQFFFDDEINMAIDKASRMYPYSTNPVRNTYGRTRNGQDAFDIFQDSRGPEGKYNPIFKLEMLGGVINQGLIAYITMGINSSATYIKH